MKNSKCLENIDPIIYADWSNAGEYKKKVTTNHLFNNESYQDKLVFHSEWNLHLSS